MYDMYEYGLNGVDLTSGNLVLVLHSAGCEENDMIHLYGGRRCVASHYYILPYLQ